jgi:hypothetical protein
LCIRSFIHPFVVQEQLKEATTEKLVGEEKQRNKLLEVTSQCELQTTTMRINHEQELDKLRMSHAQQLSEVRERHSAELMQSKSVMERSLSDVKETDAQDMKRLQEDCQARLALICFCFVLF